MRAAGQGHLLHVLTGCTAVGKTECALQWAEANSAEIISCDSLLFYRGMDLGTAKPTAEERRRVPHHLIDIRDVAETMNVAIYTEMALKVAEDIVRRGRTVLVVGGSGFYLKSFLAPVSDGLEVPAAIRTRVSGIGESSGLAGMVEELRRLNPGGLEGIDTANPRRVAGALGRCLASGRTLAELSVEFARARSPFHDWTVRLVRLDRPPAELELRVAARVQSMLRDGLLDEVRRLLDAGLRSNPSAARAIGYRESIEVIEGRAPPQGLADAIIRDTKALIKKQRTWLRTQLPEHRVIDASVAGGLSALFLG